MAAMQNNEETYLKSKAEAARFLGVSVGSIERLMHGGLQYVKVGGLVRFKPEDLAAFVEARTRGGDPRHD
jgi:excisionase family DNA binding protein